MDFKNGIWIERKMRIPSESSYYYECVPDSFVVNTADEYISINHCGDKFEIAFYEIGEVGIDFDEENDHILKIRCHNEYHYFQFVNKKDALKVCIEILNQISR